MRPTNTFLLYLSVIFISFFIFFIINNIIDHCPCMLAGTCRNTFFFFIFYFFIIFSLSLSTNAVCEIFPFFFLFLFSQTFFIFYFISRIFSFTRFLSFLSNEPKALYWIKWFTPINTHRTRKYEDKGYCVFL